jgi:hypothetical protein
MKKKYGPGDILHLILEHYGYQKKENCNCDDHVFFMNTWGPHGCIEHIDLITNWLIKSASNLNWVYKIRPIQALVKPIIRKFILIAINVARDNEQEMTEEEIKVIIIRSLPL